MPVLVSVAISTLSGCQRFGHVTDTGREFADALARVSRSEDHRKKRPAHLHLAREINALHDISKTDVGEDQVLASV